MKKIITIRTVEEKVSSNNSKYLSIEAADGRYSCWEEVLFETLKANINLPLEVEIFQKGKYENIVGAGEMMPTQKASGFFKGNVETKRKDIAEAQTRKEDSIKDAGAARDSTLIVVNFYPELAANPNKEILIKQKLEEWFLWLKNR